MGRFLWTLPSLLSLLLAAPSTASAQSRDEISSVARVCARGPDAAVADALRRRGSAEVDAASVLPNPAFVLQHQQTFEGLSERELVLGLSVPLGLGGRRFLLQDAADARKVAGDAASDGHLFSTSLALREALAVAVIDAARVDVLTAQQHSLEDVATTLVGLTRGGETSRHDVARHGTHVRLHRGEVAVAEARAAGSRALVEAWTGAPHRATLETSALVASVLDAAKQGPLDGGGSAELRALRAEERAFALDAEASRRRWVPDIELFAGYRNVAGGGAEGHGVSLGLTVPIPAFDRGQGEAARAEASRMQTRATAARASARMRAEALAARARLVRLAEGLSDAEVLEGDAAAVKADSRLLYASGEASLTDLLDAHRTHEETQLARIDRVAAVAAAVIDLMRATGSHMDPELDRACGGRSEGASR